MFFRLTVIFIISVLCSITFPEAEESILLTVAPEPNENGKPKNETVIVTASIVAASAATAGAFLIYRRETISRCRADSIINIVETSWDSSSRLYEAERYREAVAQLQKIIEVWYDYEKYSRKYRKKRRVDPDSIQAVIASCDFLESMIPPIKNLTELAERLPEDEFSLSKFTRRELAEAQKYIRNAIDSILAANPNHRNALEYSFRHINKRLQTVDSLIEMTYEQRRADFTAKNRYYYNRAVESQDTEAIRRFVEDCDYYHVDKEWCQRGHIILRERSGGDYPTASLPAKKMGVKDSIQLEYEKAMTSKRIELLEAYIAKYSSAKYRKYSRHLRLDNVKETLRKLRLVIEKESALNKNYPRFGKTNDFKIPLSIKGLSSMSENAFTISWENLRSETSRLPAVRQPAKIDIDFTSRSPLIILEAAISPEHDVERLIINSRKVFHITCLLPVMKHLQRFKRVAIELIKKDGAKNSMPDEIINYEINKISSAIYGLRLNKPENAGAIFFYSKDNDENPISIQFYDFYDITAASFPVKRFPIYPGSLPRIIPSLSSDTLEQRMGENFFGE